MRPRMVSLCVPHRAAVGFSCSSSIVCHCADLKCPSRPCPPDPCSHLRSQSATGRRLHLPHGHCWKRSVHFANMFVERLCHILRTATQLKVFWAVEQPASSAPSDGFQFTTSSLNLSCTLYVVLAASKVLWCMPCMKATLRACGARRVKFWMCSYGASSLKPTVFLASCIL